MFHIIRTSSPEDFDTAAFCRVRGAMERLRPVLGLATGGTPTGLYARMVEAYRAGTLSFADTVTFNLDEYAGLPREHEQSYHSFMFRNLFDHIDIRRENIHIPDGNSASAASDYERLLSSTRIGLQLLGIGSNGHIAFNEPGTAFDSQTHFVELKPSTIRDNARFFADVSQVPTRAVTMGIGSILRAEAILLLAKGRNKAEAVYGMICGPVTEALPASALQRHPNVTVVLDAEAASLLPETVPTEG